MEIAQERLKKNQSLAITAAWIGAALQRSKKLPKLDELMPRERRSDRQDLQMYMGRMRATLPRITLEEWRARQAAG